jgi:hypothetical protein
MFLHITAAISFYFLNIISLFRYTAICLSLYLLTGHFSLWHNTGGMRKY